MSRAGVKIAVRPIVLGCALAALLALVPRAGATALPSQTWSLEIAATSSIYQYTEHVPALDDGVHTCIQASDTTARANTVWRGSYAAFLTNIPLRHGKHSVTLFGGNATDVGFGGSAAETSTAQAGCGNGGDTSTCSGAFTESNRYASNAELNLGPENKTLTVDVSIPGSRYTPLGTPDGSGCEDGHFGTLDTLWDATLKITLPFSALNPHHATHFDWTAAMTPPRKSRGNQVVAIPDKPLSHHDELSDGGTSDATLSMHGVLSLKPAPKHRKGHHS